MALPMENVHALIERAGNNSKYAWDEFFHGLIANDHTRRAYSYAVRRFLSWCDEYGIELVDIMPGHIRKYFEMYDASVPTKKLHLSGLTHFFDVQVQRHAIALNPVKSVRSERYSQGTGKTQPIPPEVARRVIDQIDVDETIGLRDRAILGILVYTACRIGAVTKLTTDSFFCSDQWYLALQEKGGKQRTIPVRTDLQGWLLDYVDVLNPKESSPLFRTTPGRSDILTDRGMDDGAIRKMITRRLQAADLHGKYSAHSFRAGTATQLLEQGVSVDDVQMLLGHADPRTTKLYDHRDSKVTRNIVERIG